CYHTQSNYFLHSVHRHQLMITLYPTQRSSDLAYSLRLHQEIGSIEAGKRADFVLLDAPNYLHLVYHFGVNLVTAVFRDGKRDSRDRKSTRLKSSHQII